MGVVSVLFILLVWLIWDYDYDLIFVLFVFVCCVVRLGWFFCS